MQKMDANVSAVNGAYPPPNYDLHVLEPVQVHVFFRHGDRSPTPIHNARMDADLWASRVQEFPPELPRRSDYKFQEFPWGQLTKKGKDQALGLGQWLKKYYFEVLKISDKLSSSVKFRSTNYERTHFTGWYVLNGLLGSSEATASIPVDIRGKKDETLVDLGGYRRVSAMINKIMDAATKPVKRPDGTLEPTEISLLFEKVKVGIMNFLALDPNTTVNWLLMILMVDVPDCGFKHGDPLPDSVSAADLYAMKAALGKSLMTAFQDKVFMRLGMGRLMREIVEAISQYQTERSTGGVPSLYLYSGHDDTIMPLSAALGAPVKEWPGYCSNIIIELLRSATPPGQYFVRVLYNGVEQPLTLFGKSRETKILLTLDEFLEQASHTVISEEEFQSLCRPVAVVTTNVYDDFRVQQATKVV